MNITQPSHLFKLTDNDLILLDHFINGTAFYVERLEEYAHEKQDAFWDDRSGAMYVVTELLIQRIVQD